MSDEPTPRCPLCRSIDPAVRSYSAVTEWDCDGPFHDSAVDRLRSLTDSQPWNDVMAVDRDDMIAMLALADALTVKVDRFTRLGDALADAARNVTSRTGHPQLCDALDAWEER